MAARSGASFNSIGGVQVAQGDLAGALKSYLDGFTIIDHLTEFDPSNTRWQRDRGVLFARIGTVQMKQGDLAGALKSYLDGFTIIDRLAKSDPSNTGWQHDLGASFNSIGDVQVAQGDLAGAVESYRDSLTIRDRLAKSDPSNTGWQHDLQYTVGRIDDLAYQLVLAQDFTGALEAADRAIAVAPNLTWLYANRAHALMFLGSLDQAREIYLQYQGIRNLSGEKSWEAVVLEHFATLRAANLTRPLMDDIEQQFRK
jgi:tetratricopeptide (TPR) repeat protein